jgi:hypothetical protein
MIPTALPPPTDRLPEQDCMTAQLPSRIAARRMAYAKRLMQRRYAVKVRRVRELAMGHAVAFVSICALAVLLLFGLFLASAN